MKIKSFFDYLGENKISWTWCMIVVLFLYGFVPFDALSLFITDYFEKIATSLFALYCAVTLIFAIWLRDFYCRADAVLKRVQNGNTIFNLPNYFRKVRNDLTAFVLIYGISLFLYIQGVEVKPHSFPFSLILMYWALAFMIYSHYAKCRLYLVNPINFKH